MVRPSMEFILSEAEGLGMTELTMTTWSIAYERHSQKNTPVLTEVFEIAMNAV